MGEKFPSSEERTEDMEKKNKQTKIHTSKRKEKQTDSKKEWKKDRKKKVPVIKDGLYYIRIPFGIQDEFVPKE